MARLPANSILNDLRGHIGKQMVFKKYGDKTVVAAYPDMSHVKTSELQILKQNRFKDAVAYAQKINRDLALKKEYQKKTRKVKVFITML